ncbi:MAG: hydroxyacid dehydrogenase [SAR324 cluster bacterium]|nr:hydroxyacid dehydrogenase [SAR324 cluster bacterium]
MKERRKVLLPQPIEDEALQMLKENNIEIVQTPDANPETVAPLIGDVEGIVLRTGIHITRDLLDRAEKLQTISRTGGGVDNVDVKCASEKGILVTSSLGVNTTSVVEHSLALILSLSKELFLMDREMRNNNFRIRYQNRPRDLREKCLGVVGYGKIGSELAECCRGIFKMRIIAHDDYLSDEIKAKHQNTEFMSLEDLFRQADVISMHIPLTDETKEMIDWQYLQMMKQDAVIINTSRGGVIKEDDLVKALSEKNIGGAGLDVFAEEPPSADHPLLRLDNVILTPHSAALTKECVLRMATSAVSRVLDCFNGIVPESIANPEVLSQEKWRHLKKSNQ